MSSLSPPSDTWAVVDAGTEDVGARKQAGFSGWDLLLVLALLFTAFNLLGTLAAGPADPDAELPVPDPVYLEASVIVASLFAITMFAGLPVLWLSTTRVGGWHGMLTYLHWHGDGRRNRYWFGIACLATVGFVAAVFLFGLAIQYFDTPAGDPLFAAIAQNTSWFAIFLLSLSAGVGEEVMFRGVIQRYVGVYGQAAIFGAAHFNQGLAAALFIAGVALAFGFMLRRGAPIWALMFTHTIYDFILLGAAKVSA